MRVCVGSRPPQPLDVIIDGIRLTVFVVIVPPLLGRKASAHLQSIILVKTEAAETYLSRVREEKTPMPMNLGSPVAFRGTDDPGTSR